MTDVASARGRASIVSELGLVTRSAGDAVVGEAHVVPELWYPGTDVLRTSVLATWADIVTGLLSGTTMTPRIPVTLDLEVQLFRPPTGTADVTMSAAVVKAGRSIVVSDVWFHQAGVTEPFGFAHASYMASPHPDHVHPGGFPVTMRERGRPTAPVAERASVRHLGPGVAEVPRSHDGQNAVGGIQGGLVALAAEEAVRAAAPAAVLSSLAIRYLRPFLVGPAHAVATLDHGLAHVRITEGAGGKPGAVATARVA